MIAFTWTLFEEFARFGQMGLTNYYRLLVAGTREKEANSHGSKVLVDKNKHKQQNLDAPPAEYKLPLVWIDLEMTGKYVAGSLRKRSENEFVISNHPIY